MKRTETFVQNVDPMMLCAVKKVAFAIKCVKDMVRYNVHKEKMNNTKCAA